MQNESELFELFINHPKIATLDDDDKKTLFKLGTIQHFQSDQEIIKESEYGELLYFILKGSVHFLKKGKKDKNLVLSATNQEGWVGELVLIDDKLPRTASVVTTSDCAVFCIDKTTLNQNVTLKNVNKHFITMLATSLANRLRHTNEVIIKNLEEALENQKRRLLFGSFTVTLIFLLSCYIYIFAIYKSMLQNYNSILIGIFIIVFFISTWIYFIVKNKLVVHELGYTFGYTKESIKYSLWCSLPILLALPFLKALFLYYDQGVVELSAIVSPYDSLPLAYQNLSTHFFLMLYYVVFCFVQELMARGIIQQSFMQLLPYSNPWWPNIVSNLIFSAVHLHKSLTFALLTLIPGLFWGWLYSKHRSVIAVSISHALIGTTAIFIVGFSFLV